MIPKNISKADILSAMEQIDIEGTPKTRRSHIYSIRYNKKHYPPKYVISVANNIINGKELSPTDFTGGAETNNLLRKLGFEIVYNQDGNKQNCTK